MTALQRAAERPRGSTVPYSPRFGHARVYDWHLVALPQTLQATGTGLVQGKAVAPKMGSQSANSLRCCVPSGNVPWRCQSGEADRSSRAKNEFPCRRKEIFQAGEPPDRVIYGGDRIHILETENAVLLEEL